MIIYVQYEVADIYSCRASPDKILKVKVIVPTMAKTLDIAHLPNYLLMHICNMNWLPCISSDMATFLKVKVTNAISKVTL